MSINIVNFRDVTNNRQLIILPSELKKVIEVKKTEKKEIALK